MTSLKLCWIEQIQLKIELPTIRAAFLLNALHKAALKEHNKEINTSLASEGGDLNPVYSFKAQLHVELNSSVTRGRSILDIYQVLKRAREITGILEMNTPFLSRDFKEDKTECFPFFEIFNC